MKKLLLVLMLSFLSAELCCQTENVHAGIRETYDYSIKSFNSSGVVLSSLKEGISAESIIGNRYFFNSVISDIDVTVQQSRKAAEIASSVKSAVADLNCPKADTFATAAEVNYDNALNAFTEAGSQIIKASESKEPASAKEFLEKAKKYVLEGLQSLDNGTAEHKKMAAALSECDY